MLSALEASGWRRLYGALCGLLALATFYKLYRAEEKASQRLLSEVQEALEQQSLERHRETYHLGLMVLKSCSGQPTLLDALLDPSGSLAGLAAAEIDDDLRYEVCLSALAAMHLGKELRCEVQPVRAACCELGYTALVVVVNILVGDVVFAAVRVICALLRLVHELTLWRARAGWSAAAMELMLSQAPAL